MLYQLLPHKTNAKNQAKSFKLLQYFSIASLSAFVLATIALGWFYRSSSLKNLVIQGEKQNVALAKVFSNSIWSEFGTFLASTSNLNDEQLQSHPEIARLHQVLLDEMQGLPVVKVKIFDLEGRIVFSTDPKQIGMTKKNYPGVLAAREGQITTQLDERNAFIAFQKDIANRQLITFFPISGFIYY